MKLCGVYGVGGFGREVMPILRRQYSDNPEVIYVFVDDAGKFQSVNGHTCMTFAEFLNFPAEERVMTLAIADSNVRRKLASNCEEEKVSFIGVKAQDCIVLDESTTDVGFVLCNFVTIGSNVRIGRHFHGNFYSYIAHDCIIGDYVTFAPNVMCSGNVRVEDGVYIGTGAVIRQGRHDRPLVIGAGAIVGMGAVVTKDVPPGTTVVGNPARPLIKL